MSYTMYSNNHEKMIGLHDRKWDYIVLDEAHKIKNLDAAITTAVKKLKCNMKLLLTGTPLTRSLMVLHALPYLHVLPLPHSALLIFSHWLFAIGYFFSHGIY